MVPSYLFRGGGGLDFVEKTNAKLRTAIEMLLIAMETA